MDEFTPRSTYFCLVCVVDAIETDRLSRIRELLSTPEEFDDAVALAVDRNGLRHDDVQLVTLPCGHQQPACRFSIRRLNLYWDSVVRIALRADTTEILKALIDSGKFQFYRPMTFQVVPKIAEEDPEFWEEFERTSIRKIYWPYKDSLSHKRDDVNESGEYPLAVFTPLEFCVNFARWRHL